MENSDIDWIEQIKEFAAIFGFTVKYERKSWNDNHMLLFKYGKSYVYAASGNRHDDFKLLSVRLFTEQSKAQACREMMRCLSGKTIEWRWSEKDQKSPFGITKTRKERLVNLPEFDTVEELRFKLAVQNGDVVD